MGVCPIDTPKVHVKYRLCEPKLWAYKLHVSVQRKPLIVLQLNVIVLLLYPAFQIKVSPSKLHYLVDVVD